jgi:transposase-like protein
MKKYKKQTTVAIQTTENIQPSLDQLVLEGARRLIQQALQEEIHAVLGREYYEHHEPGEQKRYRNGYGHQRTLVVGSGSIPVRVPRLREPFESQIVRRYQRMSEQMQHLMPQLYLHGLATGDFRQCFDAFVGPDAPLSPASIVRLKQTWQKDYEAWSKRSLEEDYLYAWADGVYPKAGPKRDTMAVLVIVGLNQHGQKEILSLVEGYRESADAWHDVLQDLKRRGVRWIGLMIGDGSLGLWNALRDVFPQAKRQRCFLHKMRNILDKVPASKHDEVLQALRNLYYAGSPEEAQKLVSLFRASYGKLYPKALASLDDVLHELFTYMQFPKQHWPSIKSTNVIESIFASVKLRTNAAKRIPSRESALYLVFKLLITQQQRFRKINAHNLVAETIDQTKLKSSLKLRRVA